MSRKTAWAAFVLLSLTLALSLPARAEERQGLDLRPALLVMDVQNKWLPMMADSDRDSAPAEINEAIAFFRQSGFPVIAVYHSNPKRGPKPGTEPFQFPEWVAVTTDDSVVVKAHPSAFTDTHLDNLLKDSNRNTVVLCGLSATGCVLATYFGAMDRGYMAVMVKGTLLSPNSSQTRTIEDICYSASIDELATALSDSTRGQPSD